MLDEYKRVTLKGHPDAGILVYMEESGYGPLTTEEEYQLFTPGYAHVMPNGDIMRYGTKIGTKDDLAEVVEEQS